MTPRAGKFRELFVFIAVTVFLFTAAVSVDAYLGYRKLPRGDQHEEIRGVHDAEDQFASAPVPGSGAHRTRS